MSTLPWFYNIVKQLKMTSMANLQQSPSVECREHLSKLMYSSSIKKLVRPVIALDTYKSAKVADLKICYNFNHFITVEVNSRGSK